MFFSSTNMRSKKALACDKDEEKSPTHELELRMSYTSYASDSTAILH